VVVKIADNQYALYAHMQTGSVIPKLGDKVKAGDPLGKLGNSGNSTVPHLHFGIQDTADAFGSNSVPYVFKAYTLAGTGTFSADGELTVTAANTPQQETFPLMNDIVDFGQ
jgi:murein DD-endopeptidase MepM/ murein hydrolase activator NlpD